MADKAEQKPAAKKTASSKEAANDKKPSEMTSAERKEQLSQDSLVSRSGLSSVPPEALNPAYADQEVIDKVQADVKAERDEQNEQAAKDSE